MTKRLSTTLHHRQLSSAASLLLPACIKTRGTPSEPLSCYSLCLDVFPQVPGWTLAPLGLSSLNLFSVNPFLTLLTNSTSHPPYIFFFKIWNASQICMSSLHRAHANLLCIVPILVYVLPKRAPYISYLWFFFIKFITMYQTFWGFPGGTSGKESACNAGDMG